MDSLDRIVKIKEVCQITALSKSSVYKQEKEGTFPKRLKIGGNVGWRMSDIQEWIKLLDIKDVRGVANDIESEQKRDDE